MSVTATETYRLIYFIGHKCEKDSVLVTKVCKNYSTISEIYKFETATRTLSNLYNLHAIRGLIKNGKLVFKSSMSGPHHYFGYIDPKKSHTIKFINDMPVYFEEDKITNNKKKLLPNCYRIILKNYNWINGKDVNNNTKNKYNMINNDNYLVNEYTGQKDSLFDDPGILELNEENIMFEIITDGYNYDLSEYNAQIVKNNESFSFNQRLVDKFEHAQHKLRVVTYNYGDNYLDDYLLTNGGSGIFIEKHEFIQAITPMNRKCGGYVILGKEINNKLELIAVTIPFGCTLLVDVGCIHGDSTLTGMYMMAMTGNHNAMKTADTVFMKNKHTHNNVIVRVFPLLEKNNGLSGNNFLLSSNEMSLNDIKKEDIIIKNNIKKLVGFRSLYWNPVIMTGNTNNYFHNMLGWKKTLGVNL